MSSYSGINKTWGFCVLPTQPIEKKNVKHILNEERKVQIKKENQPVLPSSKKPIVPEVQKLEGEKKNHVNPETSSDELLAYMLQLEEEEKLKKSMVYRRDHKTEMEKYKYHTIGPSELVLVNTRDEGEDNYEKLKPHGWNHRKKKHNAEICGKMNSLRLGVYDGVGDLPHDWIINNMVYNRIKTKLERIGATKTTDHFLT